MRGMRYQPQGAARLSATNPLVPGLVHSWGGVNAAGPLAVRDMAGRANGVFGSGTSGSPSGNSWRVGPGGYYLNFDDSGTGITTSVNLKVGDSAGSGSTGSQVFSVVGRIRVPAFTSAAATIYGSVPGGIQVRVGGTGQIELIKEQTVVVGTSTTSITAGVDVDVAVCYDGTTASFYINGLPAGSVVNPQTFTLNGQYCLGYAEVVNERVLNGTRIYRLDVWNRALPAAQVKSWSDNRWQIFEGPYEDDEVAPVAGLTLAPIAAALSMAGFTATISQARVIAPAAASLTLTGYAPTITQPVTLSPAGAALALQGFTPTVTQAMPQTIAPAGAALSLVGGAPAVTQGTQAPPSAGGGGGGAGPVREVRAFGDLLDRARKPTRSEKRKRRQQLETEALELLPNLPEAEKLAPIAARIVFEQEARAMAPLYANRPIQAMAPVVMPFDAGAALRELVARLVAEAQLQRLDADDESDIELLLLGS